MKRLLTLILFFSLFITAGKAQVQRLIGDSVVVGFKPNAKINLDGKIYLKRVDTGTGTDSILVIKNGVVKKVVPVDISGKANLVGDNTFTGDNIFEGTLDVPASVYLTGGTNISGYLWVNTPINAHASIHLNNNKITHLATPTVATDATNKSYVDAGLANKENLSNKVTNLTGASNTTYPTSLAVANAIASIASGVQYQGLWDASTNTPALPTAAAGNNGWFYIVSASGSYGGESYVVGDWVMSDGSVWGKVPMSGLVANKADVDGSNATGTWGINISGNAASATNWGGRSANLNEIMSGMAFILGRDNSDGVIKLATPSNVQSFLGLGSAAYQPATAFQSALGYTPYNPASYPVNAGGETLQSVTDRGRNISTSTGPAIVVISDNGYFQFVGADAITPIGYVGANATNGFAISAQNSGKPLRFLTNSGEHVRLTDAGNVGIGTTSPTAKLEVNGNVIASHATASNHLVTKAQLDAVTSSETLASVSARGSSTGTSITTEGIVSNDDVLINGLLEVTQPITTHSTTPGKRIEYSGDNIVINDGSGYQLTLQKDATSLTANHTQYFQNKTGHVALLSDIPSQPTILTGSTAYSGGTIAPGNHVDINITVVGAVSGDVVAIGNQHANAWPGLIIKAYASSDGNNVRISMYNATSTSITVTSTTFKVKVFK